MLDLKEEKKLFKKKYKFVAGIDEAGRGPLAGPVVAVCVVINKDFKITKDLKEIADSKKLTIKKREELFKSIQNSSFNIGVGICDHKIIDKINILQATFLAMKKAINSLEKKPDFILLDGNLKIPNINYEQRTIIKGDSVIFLIATASIIAKVTRDRIMKKMDEKYPNYFFKDHKGYGTKKHIEMIKKYGPCPIHRISFKPIKGL